MDKQKNGHTIHRYTRAEIIAEIDQGARARLNLSASDLIRRYKSGRLSEPGRVGDILMLAGLLPKKHPLYVEL